MSMETIIFIGALEQNLDNQIPYYIQHNIVQIRTGPKLLSKFNESLNADHIFQNEQYMAQHIVENIIRQVKECDSYKLLTILLIEAQQSQKIKVIEILGKQCLNQKVQFTMILRPNHFTQYQMDEQDLSEYQFREKDRNTIGTTVRKLSKPTEVITFQLKAQNKQHKLRLNIYFGDTKTEAKCNMLEGQLIEYIKIGPITDKEYIVGSQELKSSNKVYFLTFLPLDRKKQRERNFCIRLLNIVSNKIQVNLTKKVIHSEAAESIILTGLKQELQKAEKTRLQMIKRAFILSSIQNQVLSMLGDEVQTLKNNKITLDYINEFRSQLKGTLSSISDKIESLVEQKESLTEKTKQEPLKAYVQTYQKMTTKLKGKIEAKSSTASSLSTQAYPTRQVGNLVDYDQDDRQSEYNYKFQLYADQLQRQHQKQLQQLREQHKNELKSMKLVKDLQTLLTRAKKYPSLTDTCTKYSNMIKL